MEKAGQDHLVVLVRGPGTPPWGSWQALSPVEAERRTFTEFRKRVNEIITPHGVDHVEFREDAVRVTR